MSVARSVDRFSYLSGTTPVHAVDARAKLVASLLVVASLMLARNPETGLLPLAVCLVVLLVAGNGLGGLVEALRPLTVLIVGVVVVQCLVGPEPVAQVAGIRVSQEGARHALVVVMRIVALASISLAVTTTTSPTDLARALEWLLSPLRAVRVPVADMGLMLAIAIRFVPTMAGELARLEQAQLARGLDARRASLRVRLRLRAALIVPLCVRAFRRARTVAESMQARGYVRGAERTQYRTRSLRSIDIVTVAVAAAVACIVVVAR